MDISSERPLDSSLISSEVMAVLEDIQLHSPEFDIYLGGGYLRDMSTYRTPKDIDIFFVPKKGSCKSAYYTPEGFFVNYRKPAAQISDMEGRGVYELTGLFCGTKVYSEYQYIVYAEHKTIEELAEDMDFNICQIMYSVQDKTVFATEAFKSGHQNHVLECIQDYDKERTWFRYERMVAKFPSYEVVGCPERPSSALFKAGKTRSSCSVDCLSYDDMMLES